MKCASCSAEVRGDSDRLLRLVRGDLLVLVVLAAIAVYGFRIALAGRPMFSGMRLED